MALSAAEIQKIRRDAAAAGMTPEAYLDKLVADQEAEVARLEKEKADIDAALRRARSESLASIDSIVDEMEADGADPRTIAELRRIAQRWADPNNELG